jgi:hypothetical protein
MRNLKRWIPLFTALALFIGCGDDDDDNVVDIATTVTARPPSGSTVPSNAKIELNFDEPVDAVAGATDGTSIVWFIPVQATLTITWTNTDGSAGGPVTFNYTVTGADTDSPQLLSSTVSNNAADIDPESLNTAGIQFVYDEPIDAGDVLCTSTPISWETSGGNENLTLTPSVALEPSTTYTIDCSVYDLAENRTEIWQALRAWKNSPAYGNQC